VGTSRIFLFPNITTLAMVKDKYLPAAYHEGRESEEKE
jgi:hypothetical protein